MGILLEAAKEEGFVFAQWSAQRETIDIAAENRLGRLIQLIYIRYGLKALRLITPQQGSVQLVGPRLRDHIENSAPGSPKLDAEVARLYGDFRHGVGDVERLSHSGELNVIVFSTVEQVVVPTHALAIDGKICGFPAPCNAPPWHGSRRAASGRARAD